MQTTLNLCSYRAIQRVVALVTLSIKHVLQNFVSKDLHYEEKNYIKVAMRLQNNSRMYSQYYILACVCLPVRDV